MLTEDKACIEINYKKQGKRKKKNKRRRRRKYTIRKKK
jgi:hypothetical protein